MNLIPMPQRSLSLCIALRVEVFIVVLCLTTAGCARKAIEANREKSTAAYQEHLRAVPADGETPEQAAQTAKLRQQVLHDEWVRRGYRVGNENGAGTVFYSAAGRGVLSVLWLPFKLMGQAFTYSFEGDRPNRAARFMEYTR